jgi:hypothetical protein
VLSSRGRVVDVDENITCPVSGSNQFMVKPNAFLPRSVSVDVTCSYTGVLGAKEYSVSFSDGGVLPAKCNILR